MPRKQTTAKKATEEPASEPTSMEVPVTAARTTRQTRSKTAPQAPAATEPEREMANAAAKKTTAARCTKKTVTRKTVAQDSPQEPSSSQSATEIVPQNQKLLEEMGANNKPKPLVKRKDKTKTTELTTITEPTITEPTITEPTIAELTIDSVPMTTEALRGPQPAATPVQAIGGSPPLAPTKMTSRGKRKTRGDEEQVPAATTAQASKRRRGQANNEEALSEAPQAGNVAATAETQAITATETAPIVAPPQAPLEVFQPNQPVETAAIRAPTANATSAKASAPRGKGRAKNKPARQYETVRVATPAGRNKTVRTGTTSARQRETVRAGGSSDRKSKAQNTAAGGNPGGSGQGSYNQQGPQGAGLGDLSKRPLYEYYCMPRPLFDVIKEAREAGGPVYEEDISEQYYANEERDEGPGIQPIANFPDHKWFSMWNTWRTLANLHRFASYRDPENFGMHVSNDFYGCGIQELIGNYIKGFNETTIKQGDEKINAMWSTVAGLFHWFHREDMQPFYMVDDPEAVGQTCLILCHALLTTLYEIDHAGLLTTDSRIKDLMLVMALAVASAEEMVDMGIEEHVYWRHAVVAYANKAGIDLGSAVPIGTQRALDKIKKEKEDADLPANPYRDPEMGTKIRDYTTKAMAPPSETDPWQWATKFTIYFETHGVTGEKHNVLWMSRKDRKEYSLNNKDPLQGFSAADLRAGKIMLQ